jgi:aspartate-semialdehyde dehydrogenase
LADPKEKPLFALVGGDTLLAREIRELLEKEVPAPRVELVSATVDNAVVVAKAAFLGPQEDEALVMSPLTAESLAGAQVVFLAGSPASSRRALKLSAKGKPALIDLTGALEEQPTARLRAPSIEQTAAPGSAIHVIAHPAAIAIAELLSALAAAGAIRRSIIHVFEPASERGKKGLDELQQQTVAVLSFKKLKMDVFDAQLAFNLLARYGQEAEEPLEGIEQRVEKHLASLLASGLAHGSSPRANIPMPSLRLIQAPVFHGHSFSVWIEFEDNPGVKKIAQALAGAGIDVRSDDPPSNAKVAGESGLSVGAIAADSNQPRACWLWAVSDNLRLAGEHAVAVAREIVG